MREDDTREQDVLDDLLTDDDAARPARGRRTGRRIVGWSIAALLVAVVAAAALLALDALRARDALAEAVPLVQAAEQQLEADPTADVDLAHLQDLTTTARTSTDGPLWWLAARLPGLGADVHAVSVSADAVDVVTHDVLPPLLAARDGVDLAALRPVDGRVDLAPIQAAAPLVREASDALAGVVADVAALDPAELRGAVAGPVESLQAGLATLDEQLTSARAVTTVLPPLLGADGEQRYLVLFLTNSELRSAGGIPGALAVLTADDGRVALTDQVSTADVGPFDDPVPGLAPEDAEIFGDRPARYIQDTTMLPDFPSAASLAATMWEASGRGAVDGVISVDPVALSYVLTSTGPVDVPGGRIDADGAVDLLLSGAYAMFPEPAQQDEFFAGVSAAVFGSALGGAVDPSLLATAVERAAQEHRINVWSRDADLQADLVGLGVGGSLAAEPAASGVFLNDGTGAKLDYYLDVETTSVAACAADADAVTLTRTVTLTSSVPADVAQLPWYVLGSAGAGSLEPGVLRTNVAIYSPAGGSIDSIARDGVVIGGDVHDDGAGRQVTVVTVELAPGESTTLTVTTSGAAGAGGTWMTPTARHGGDAAVATCG
ncbi:conserved hypothetical protein [Beutenbergia cavernae DSM 12333]|uniref:DUF4012 domain-containing protein n=1 Tax=Beutenbergia cavernae (strain ATCC BAA-8 / DSM 12333 / CCUG 43141 / JCM 11478 / NBRC 16432 / NCIMB 13614 / HKI 0122) TaxID=471853 RepID=C5BX44_BEUC1|nr:conserved hypothetical protein [Beutenbergia cavernae DSM 12333]